MPPRISFKPYRRPFASPLQTAESTWRIREGFILRYEVDTHVGYGEVAPIPSFGTETIEQAASVLKALQEDPELPITDSHPCCAFALSTARSSMRPAERDYAVAALLPAGPAAVGVAVEKVAQGFHTLKWKVGVEPLAQEQATFRLLALNTPKNVRVRLDANASWTPPILRQWMDFLQPFRERIEFVEQPLPPGQEACMAAMVEELGVAIALDESLNGSSGAKWLQEWQGPLVVKPALMGDFAVLVSRLQPIAAQVVFSSVFETGVGLSAALRMADALPGMGRAIGFDTLNFTDNLSQRKQSAWITKQQRTGISPDQIWIDLPHLT